MYGLFLITLRRTRHLGSSTSEHGKLGAPVATERPPSHCARQKSATKCLELVECTSAVRNERWMIDAE
jgi:hypothetical protein